MSQCSAKVSVGSQFANPVDITLHHREGTDGDDESYSWEGVHFGAVTDPPLVVTYETGFLTPRDVWQVTVVVSDGPDRGTWTNDEWTACELEDTDNGVSIRFDVGPDYFHINIPSGGKNVSLIKVA